MPTPSLSDEALQRAVDMLALHGSQVKAAAAMGLSRATLQSQLLRANSKGFVAGATRGRPDFSTPVLPEDVADASEIIARRIRGFARKQIAHDARKLIPISINVPGPIGLAIFGDLHIDNDGTNMPLLLKHTEMVKNTEGMFAGSMGDLQDGWVGRLARLWANTSMSAQEAWKLVEWWIKELDGKLVWICQGNHDSWARNVNGISPVDWIAQQQNTVAEQDGVRMSIELPSGQRYTINCRHDFRGRSAFNAAHGITKAALWGWRDDVLLAGHTHQSAYNVVKDPMSGRVSHAVRVASYKHIDEYAKEGGLPDENIFECPVLLLDPDEEDPRHRVAVEFNPMRAARTLGHMRADWKARQKSSKRRAA